MTATVAADFAFEPKVWQDHIMAYFDQKLVFGATAFRDNTLTTQPGLTVTFPYFKPIGDAEEPAESEGLQVDSISDDSFTATVKEVAKAVGIKKKAFKKSATSSDRIIQEVQMQLGRKMAEKVDNDLLAEFSASGNFVNGYTATQAGDVMTVNKLATAKIKAFGDRAGEALVCQMHSRQLLDLMRDATFAGLKADNTLLPGMVIDGMVTQLLGMIIIVNDKMPATAAQISSTDAYRAFIHKADAYGICMKQDMEVESDYDILHREWVFTTNEWYAVKSLHAKVATDDLRTAEIITTVGA